MSQNHNNTLDAVRGYIASIEGWLWGRNDINITGRLNAIKNDARFKQLMAPPVGMAPATMTPFILRLDHIAYDIKVAANNEYECTPVTQNEDKTLSTSNAALRTSLGGLIDQFSENSQNEHAAGTQTLVHLPSPNTTYRIDRENLSAPPSPRFWTYRIQVGNATYGGIRMQSGVLFTLVSVRAALHTSLASSAADHRFYVRLSAPPWLTNILNA